MFIVHVFVHVKADSIEPFKQATLVIATNSVQEAGIARYDVVQQRDEHHATRRIERY